ncbi:hypothetical protein Lal_00009409 [Lupinus albus]|nr:hypothetical protein Lal_00009409 [Lupinus albus]
MNLPESYIPILIQAGVAIGFVAISLLGAHFLGPKQKKGNSVKNQSWECGVPVEGNARTPFSIKYFLTARIRNGRIPCRSYIRGNLFHGIFLCVEKRRFRLG